MHHKEENLLIWTNCIDWKTPSNIRQGVQVNLERRLGYQYLHGDLMNEKEPQRKRSGGMAFKAE